MGIQLRWKHHGSNKSSLSPSLYSLFPLQTVLGRHNYYSNTLFLSSYSDPIFLLFITSTFFIFQVKQWDQRAQVYSHSPVWGLRLWKHDVSNESCLSLSPSFYSLSFFLLLWAYIPKDPSKLSLSCLELTPVNVS